MNWLLFSHTGTEALYFWNGQTVINVGPGPITPWKEDYKESDETNATDAEKELLDGAAISVSRIRTFSIKTRGKFTIKARGVHNFTN